jgi:Glycosyl transferase family 2
MPRSLPRVEETALHTPRFSIVIPTRDRADTLAVALQTCLTQDYDDYEVVVYDNGSSSAARDVVETASSPKVKYFRAPEPLAMSASWELALSHARGEYVTVLGDDDGLFSYALCELDGLLKAHRVEAVRWDAAMYLWPTVRIAEEAHFLSIPLGRELWVVDALRAIAAVGRFEACYTTLPTVYNAVVHRRLIAALRERVGRVFSNTQPDVYSGLAIAYVARKYLSVGAPMSVAGLSRKSNGVANLCLRGRDPVADDYKNLNARQGFVFHPWVPQLPLFPVVPVADSFLFAKAALFPEDDTLRLDRKILVGDCVRSLTAETPEEWREAFLVIRDTLRDDAELQSWFDSTFEGAEPVLGPGLRLRPADMGFQGTHLHLSADEFGVTNVLEAARLCEKILRPGRAAIRYEVVPPPPLPLQLLEKERQISTLAAAAEERLQAIRQLTAAVDNSRRQIESLKEQLREPPPRSQRHWQRGGFASAIRDRLRGLFRGRPAA